MSATAEEEGRRLYAQRFSRYRAFAERPEEEAAELSFQRLRFLRFVTASLKILDEQEFGDALFVAAEVDRRPRDVAPLPTPATRTTMRGSKG